MENFETVFLACAWVLVIVMMISFIAVFIILIRVAVQLIFQAKKSPSGVKNLKTDRFRKGGLRIMEGDILVGNYAPEVKEKETAPYRDTSIGIIRG